jgi:hypothetical protein
MNAIMKKPIDNKLPIIHFILPPPLFQRFPSCDYFFKTAPADITVFREGSFDKGFAIRAFRDQTDTAVRAVPVFIRT